jgi:hypothetical protein
MKKIYTVCTRDGITFYIEASSNPEAQHRANSSIIRKYFARMMLEALSHVISVELFHGPVHLIKHPVLDEEFFKANK